MAKRKNTKNASDNEAAKQPAPDAVRVLHFADVHIGMENYGRTDGETGLSSRVVDFLRRMEEMIKFAGENDVDLVIFACLQDALPKPHLSTRICMAHP